MATIGNTFPNLIDVYRGQGRDGRNLAVVEALNRYNPVQLDAVAVEANDGTSHKSVIRTGLPQATWGKLYQGIPQFKSTKQAVVDATGMVENLSTVDERMAAVLGGSVAELRADEARASLEAISQEMQTNFFYSDTATTPERFKGLGARYNSLTNSQVVDGGGTGVNNTSIFLVSWGVGRSVLIYPKGTMAGIDRQDMGKQRVLDEIGNPYYAYEELFRQHVGLAVQDWRYNGRVANIDADALRAGSVDLYGLLRSLVYKTEHIMDQAKSNNPLISSGKTVLYMNRTTAQALDRKTNEADKVQLSRDEVAGGMIRTYLGIPIRLTDAIIDGEQRVV